MNIKEHFVATKYGCHGIYVKGYKLAVTEAKRLSKYYNDTFYVFEVKKTIIYQ